MFSVLQNNKYMCHLIIVVFPLTQVPVQSVGCVWTWPTFVTVEYWSKLCFLHLAKSNSKQKWKHIFSWALEGCNFFVSNIAMTQFFFLMSCWSFFFSLFWHHIDIALCFVIFSIIFFYKGRGLINISNICLSFSVLFFQSIKNISKIMF